MFLTGSVWLTGTNGIQAESCRSIRPSVPHLQGKKEQVQNNCDWMNGKHFVKLKCHRNGTWEEVALPLTTALLG